MKFLLKLTPPFGHIIAHTEVQTQQRTGNRHEPCKRGSDWKGGRMKNTKPSNTEEMLEKQLQLLSEHSQKPDISPESLAELTNQMVNVAKYLDFGR